MNIDSIDLVNSHNTTIATLSFRDPGATNPYIMKNLYGLDADEITPISVPGHSAKTQSHALRMKQREIVMRIVLNPNFSAGQTYSDLRDELYKAIASYSEGILTLNFKLGGTVKATIWGHITKFEVPHTQQEPELQITLFCSDPMLKAPNVTQVDTTGWSTSPQQFTNPGGTAPSGCKIGLRFNGTTSYCRIEDGTTGSGWEFYVSALYWGGGSSFQVNDELHINSIDGEREVYGINASNGNARHGLANLLKAYSEWPKVYPGTQTIDCDASSSVEWLYFEYTENYWGI